jgi:hypothetical protein
MSELEALKAWVRELFTHSGVHHSLPTPPVDLTPTEPAQEPDEVPVP